MDTDTGAIWNTLSTQAETAVMADGLSTPFSACRVQRDMFFCCAAIFKKCGQRSNGEALVIAQPRQFCFAFGLLHQIKCETPFHGVFLRIRGLVGLVLVGDQRFELWTKAL